VAASSKRPPVRLDREDASQGHLWWRRVRAFEVSAMLSVHPDRFLVSVPVSAVLPVHHETWFEFGRSIGEPCSGGTTGVLVQGAHHTLTFVLPPETDQPGRVASRYIERAAANQPWTRYAIKVAGDPFVERMSNHGLPTFNQAV
jgi:hypothetical protein